MNVLFLLACVGTKESTDTGETPVDTDTDVSADDTAPPVDTAPAPPETFVGEVGVVFTDFGASDLFLCRRRGWSSVLLEA